MARRYFSCDPNRLRLLLQDGLPQQQQAEVVNHLDECHNCQQAIEGLAADRGLWNELRRLHGLGEPSGSGLAGAGTPQLPVETSGPDNAADGLGNELPLDFLAPAEDPSHLGQLGPFAVTAILGRGGMGMVFKAQDAALNRPVAIKVLAPHFASSGAARKRFAREAQAAAAVVHEHVVPIHSVDSWKGLPYLVMAYVSGRSLQERIDRDGPLEVKEILRIGMQAASGLAAAHAQGLVHRDVKPANILLENGVERVRLTDFGLARAVDDASLTQSGVVAGTPQYMAPEQALGEAIDHRADLFSLGSTLYATCTGHAPFRADSAMAVLRRVCDEQPRPIRSINPDIPDWLAAIIEKLHAKKPADRFGSAAEVADLLGQCLAHVQRPETVLLPAIARCRKSRFLRRHGWPVAAGLAVVVLGVGGTAGRHWITQSRLSLSASDAQPAAEQRESQPKLAPAAPKEEDPVQRQMEEIRRRAAALEADLKQPAGAGPADPSEQLLQETRQRLRALERDLGATAPGP